MKRITALMLMLFVCNLVKAQTSDSGLIRESSFEDHRYEETVPDSLSVLGRAAVKLNRQLTGECWYEPECYLFVGQAVKEFGLIPGLIITTDRLTRCSRIGTASRHHFSEDGKVHEGVEAYRPTKKKVRR